MVETERVSELVGGHQQQAVAAVLAEAELSVRVKVLGGGAPGQAVVSAHDRAVVVTFALEHEGESARSSLAVATLGAGYCGKSFY